MRIICHTWQLSSGKNCWRKTVQVPEDIVSADPWSLIEIMLHPQVGSLPYLPCILVVYPTYGNCQSSIISLGFSLETSFSMLSRSAKALQPECKKVRPENHWAARHYSGFLRRELTEYYVVLLYAYCTMQLIFSMMLLKIWMGRI